MFKDLRKYSTWKKFCRKILKKPYPPTKSSSEISQDEIERDESLHFQHYSNWELICEDILDTEHSHVYYRKCYEELLSRGKSGEEILKMWEFAWHTAGWLNYGMKLWEWVSLDEKDIERAILLLLEKKEITEIEKDNWLAFLKLHA